MSRHSTRSIPGEYEPVDALEDVGNETIVPSNKGKEPETTDASELGLEIDISNYVVYRKMMEKDPSKTVKITKVIDQEEFRKVLYRKEGSVWYKVIASTLQQQEEMTEKYLDLKKRNKDLRSLQSECAKGTIGKTRNST